MKMWITVEKLKRFHPCCSKKGEKYCESNLRKKLGTGKTPLQIANMRSIPVEDRIWVLLRPEVLGKKGLEHVLKEIVDYRVKKHCLHCEIREVEDWAKDWLSGVDRSIKSAQSAQSVVWSAFWSAPQSATRSAAYSTVQSVVWSTRFTMPAVWSTARYAVRSAGSAGSDEERRQLRIIRKYLKEKED